MQLEGGVEGRKAGGWQVRGFRRRLEALELPQDMDYSFKTSMWCEAAAGHIHRSSSV